MNLNGCPREKELCALLARGQWPTAAAPDLRAHVSTCRSCSDLALVSETLQTARAQTLAAARPVPAGVLWWRAQLRRRNAAVEQLARPLLGAQIFAMAVVLLAGLGFLLFEARHNDAWLLWLQHLPQDPALRWDNLRATLEAAPHWSWLLMGPALALLGGIAVYVATDRQ